MTGKTHQIIGITSGFAYYIMTTNPHYAPATFAGAIIASSIGSLLPDIDQPAAKIWNILPFGKTVGRAVSSFIEHRNISHSILGFIIFGYFIKILINSFPIYWGIDTNLVFISFLIGYGSHLISDMITVEGIPILFPYHGFMGFPPRPFEGARMVTGKWFENLVIFPIINIVLILLIIEKYRIIKMILFK